MTEPIRALLGEIKNGLERLYGPRLKGVYLFGSHARDEADSESDVDLLVVLDTVGRYAAEIERTSELVSALSLDHRVTVSRVFVPEQAWLRADTPFLLNAREGAVPA